ncbi:hypothetical protein [Vibrio phage BONAISHI]|nr:hypothetical protein [Vibrio phage BONAISHI]
MELAQINSANNFVINEGIKRVRDHTEKPDNYVIITPRILSGMKYQLPHVMTCPVIFIDFNKFNPLKIPHHVIFKKRVIIAQSIISAMADCHFEKELVLSDVDFNFSHNLPNVESFIFVDEPALQAYIEKKSINRVKNNRTLIKLERNGDGLTMRTLILDAFNKIIPVDIKDYLKQTGVNFRYIKREDTYYIDGDLLLHGPIPFTVPKGYIINGDLIIIDDAGFRLPSKLKIAGELDIRGSL